MSPDGALLCRRVRVEGRVQGVGYREACVRQARASGLGGWVRNRRDGSVEVLVQGPAEAVERLLAWLRQGPPSAQVTGLSVVEEQPLPAPLGPLFEWRATE